MAVIFSSTIFSYAAMYAPELPSLPMTSSLLLRAIFASLP